MHPARLLRFVPLLIAVVAAIGFAGCGGSDSGGGETPQEQAGQDAAAKEAARISQAAAETYFTDNQSYVGATKGTLAQIEPRIAREDVTISGTADSYEITAKSPSSNTFTLKRDASGAVTHSCEKPGEGGCPSNGSW